MSFASKYNKMPRFHFDTTGFTYVSLADLYAENGAEHVYPLNALYVNTKSKYGDQPVAATDTNYVAFPKWMLETVRSITDDPEAVDDINSGRVAFRIYTYQNKRFDKPAYGVEFVDV